MTCRVVHTPLGTAFICSRGADIPRCACGRKATHRCDYALRGRKAGEVCGKSLCERCRRETPIGDLCRVHGELLEEQQRRTRGEPLSERVTAILFGNPQQKSTSQADGGGEEDATAQEIH